MRKLASIRRIAYIERIEGADNIVIANVDGWQVVIKKDEFNAGDLAIYIEIDSWVPHDLAPFLSKGNEPREYNGVKGERLRTIKLRGQVSQGLLLPVESSGSLHIIEWMCAGKSLAMDAIDGDFNPEGFDVTDILGIQKWEAPIPAQLQGQAAGTFPTSLIPKTDQPRIQNFFDEIKKHEDRFVTRKVWNDKTQTLEEHPPMVPSDLQRATYEVTMKLDGSSCTIFRWEGELRVCSRNLELKINEENKDNTFVAMALKIGDKIPDGFAFQGELMGPGIQGNREGFTEHKFFVFDIFNIQEHAYLPPLARQLECKQRGLDHVPVLDNDFWPSFWAPASVGGGLALAKGRSINHDIREGIVWKCVEDPSFSFKIINNQFLLEGGD